MIYLPSIEIFPETGYKILVKQLNNVDFPAPVLPTTPIFSPFSILKEIFLITKGKPSRYRVE